LPRIFDNIEQDLLPALWQTLEVSTHADFCVGYFNLRGWKQLDDRIQDWSGGEGQCCRLLVGMHKLPQEELHELFHPGEEGMDNQTAQRKRRELAAEFRKQLTLGIPTNEDEAGLRRLAKQIKAKKLVVKLFLRHPLHAKLYLLFRPDVVNPATGFVGSSNLTLAGLSHQGELNVDVQDHDACDKLARWFEDRWTDQWCVDISSELVSIIEESWAREIPIPPYHIYIKMAYHLAEEARIGVSEFRIPQIFGNKLFEFQVKAVQIAAHHLNKRGGVLLGDVVGLGKTLMATALARIFEDDHDLETLILCPKNLQKMWEDYRSQYGLRGKVLSLTQVGKVLTNLRRYRLVLIDESHNLRNREGQRYRIIRDYVERNDSKCILLSATPYNKAYTDLSSQLNLFLPIDKDLGVRPERYIRELTETEFIRRHQCGVRTLAAFEKSPYAEDWQELMRLFLVRRTRSFIQKNYATTDPANGRQYLTFESGQRSYFPERVPKTVKFKIDNKNPDDQYARLYAPDVVDTINHLTLPRYGLANYIAPAPHEPPTRAESSQLDNLSRAGRRLMGFCRVNLFKRLESSGQAFLQSIERHILRNFVFLHALKKDLPLPIGAQDAELLDSRFTDEDADGFWSEGNGGDDADEESTDPSSAADDTVRTQQDFEKRAGEVYAAYAGPLRRRFKWLRASLFVPALTDDLLTDAKALLGVLKKSGPWNPEKDEKLRALLRLVTKTHPDEKVLVFTQFADTVLYLEQQLRENEIEAAAGVTGGSADPTGLAWRFSPESNAKRALVPPDQELRVLVATDVLSEGQNLQDCAVVVNYDLPWAIIRLIQRAGRVDRIGQKAAKILCRSFLPADGVERIGQQAETILCYSFLPADGVERIIRLRARVRQRLQENAEVVGADEAFFEDDRNPNVIRDLYNEKSGLLDDEADTEVDLASHAYQIWKNAITRDPELETIIPQIPSVVYSTKAHDPDARAGDGVHALLSMKYPLLKSAGGANGPEGVLVFLRTSEGNDALVWMDRQGNNVTESQFAVLDAAACAPDTPAEPRHEDHHALVRKAVELVGQEENQVGGQLGRPSGARFRVYERLNQHATALKEETPLFARQELLKAIDEIYRYPLTQVAIDTLNRQLKSGVNDDRLAAQVLRLRDEGRLCQIHEESAEQEPQIICSLGLFRPGQG
jgi:superfamily II DNA or RNA helicase